MLLDLTLPDMNGLEVVRAVKQESPSTEVLIVTMHFYQTDAGGRKSQQYARIPRNYAE